MQSVYSYSLLCEIRSELKRQGGETTTGKHTGTETIGIHRQTTNVNVCPNKIHPKNQRRYYVVFI